MSRKRMIRKKWDGWTRRAADIAFWLVALLAVCYGGTSAINGHALLQNFLTIARDFARAKEPA